MERTSGKYYVLSALKRKYADRIPATVLIGPYCCKMTGYSIMVYFLSDLKFPTLTAPN